MSRTRGPRFGDSRRVFRLLVRFARGQRKAFVLAFLMLLFEAVTAVFDGKTVLGRAQAEVVLPD